MRISELATITLVITFALFSVFKAEKYLFAFSKQSSIEPTALLGTYDFNSPNAIFDNQLLNIPPYQSEVFAKKQVMGDTNLNKRIEIDLTNQRLYAYEGDQKVYDFLISSGKWGRTPVGNFRIWAKLRYTLMKGGSKALNTYYYLPNVPYVMFFYNEETPKLRGYGIHGTYWHSNFGTPMSHGCINMRTEEAALIYEWVKPDPNGKNIIFAGEENPGTEVIIYGKAPSA